MGAVMVDSDKASRFVLGTLSPDERASVTRERLFNRDLDSEIIALERFYAAATAQVGGAATEDDAAPMPNIWSRIEGAVIAEAHALSGVALEGFGDGGWEPHDAPGIDFKQLWDENSILIRCVPGGAQDAHDQPSDQDEHIIVIAGELHMGGRVFATGDYLCVPAGTTHGRMHSTTGCILFTQYR